MDLRIEFRSSMSDGNLFVSLPSDVCDSLAEKGIYFAALRIQRPRKEPVFVGWTGSACRHGCIELDSSLGRLLDFSERSICRVELLKSISGTVPPELAGKTVTLSPIYEGAHEARDETFSALAAAIPVLERSLLQQIRILHKGLRFPISLPGNRSVSVCVEYVSAISSNTSNHPYIILVPDSRILLSPPHRSTTKGRSELCGVLRALPYPSSEREREPTYALLPNKFLQCTSRDDLSAAYIYVSVPEASESEDSSSFPVAVFASKEVPAGHIQLPEHIFVALRIPPLTPVDFSPCFPSMDAPSGLVFKTESAEWALSAGPTQGVTLTSVRELSSFQPPTVLFPGMQVEGTRDFVSGNSEKGNVSRSYKKCFVGPWDREWTESHEDKSYPLDNNDGKLSSLTTKRMSALAWILDKHTRIERRNLIFGDTEQFSCFGKGENSLENELCFCKRRTTISETPSGTARVALSLLLASSESQLLQFQAVDASLCKESIMNSCKLTCNLLILEGPCGSGKTFIAKRFSCILRERAKARTIWVRCQSHRGEPQNATIDRIIFAFRAASNGGPGLIVFDDAEYFFGNTDDKNESNPQGRRLSKPLSKRLVECLITRLQLYKNTVLAVFVCNRAEDLVDDLRVPGIISGVITVPYPSLEDRMEILSFMFRSTSGLDSSTGRNEHADRSTLFDGSRSQEQLRRICESADGFAPEDLRRVVERSTLSTSSGLSLADPENDIRGTFFDCVSSITKKMIPLSRKGIQLANRESDSKLKWIDVGGLMEAKSIIREMLELPSKHPRFFKNAPVRQPKGILLYGPPGCGKSLLASAAADASGMRSIFVRGPELLRKYIGESEAEVRRVFERASAVRPCIIIFDEFDSLALRRGGHSTGVADRVVNTLLTALDGVEQLAEGVFIIATSNRPESIDPALLRPGRVDKWVFVGLPLTIEERRAILFSVCQSLEDVPMEQVLHFIAESTQGYSGADLQAIIIEIQLCLPNSSLNSIDQDSLASLMPIVQDVLSRIQPSISAAESAQYDINFEQFRAKLDSSVGKMRDPEKPDNKKEKSTKASSRLALQ